MKTQEMQSKKSVDDKVCQTEQQELQHATQLLSNAKKRAGEEACAFPERDDGINDDVIDGYDEDVIAEDTCLSGKAFNKSDGSEMDWMRSGKGLRVEGQKEVRRAEGKGRREKRTERVRERARGEMQKTSTRQVLTAVTNQVRKVRQGNREVMAVVVVSCCCSRCCSYYSTTDDDGTNT